MGVDDAPVPFKRGLFDMATWVSHDPVDALLLKSLGLNATSLADPFGTLGSREGLWHLQDLGVLSPRGTTPKGTLVIVDPDRQLRPSRLACSTGSSARCGRPERSSRGRISGDLRAGSQTVVLRQGPGARPDRDHGQQRVRPPPG